MLSAAPQVSDQPKKKTVRFFRALDPEEEDRRTKRGVEARRKQKEERKRYKLMVKARGQELSPEQTLNVLMNPAFGDRLCNLARDPEDPIFNLVFTAFYKAVRGLDLPGPILPLRHPAPARHDLTVREKLERLRNATILDGESRRFITYQDVNRPGPRNCLKSIASLPSVRREFRDDFPILPVSSTSDDEDHEGEGEAAAVADGGIDESKEETRETENYAAAAEEEKHEELGDQKPAGVPAQAAASAAENDELGNTGEDDTDQSGDVNKRQRLT